MARCERVSYQQVSYYVDGTIPLAHRWQPSALYHKSVKRILHTPSGGVAPRCLPSLRVRLSTSVDFSYTRVGHRGGLSEKFTGFALISVMPIARERRFPPAQMTERSCGPARDVGRSYMSTIPVSLIFPFLQWNQKAEGLGMELCSGGRDELFRRVKRRQQA